MGTSGSVLLNRLSEIPDWQILGLEAGEIGNDFTDIPGFNTYTRTSDFNWAYLSTPQKRACLGLIDRKCIYPTGKGVGGSTILNNLLYSRGSSRDYDGLGLDGWSFYDVLPYFVKAERFDGWGDYHGYFGPMPVQFTQPSTIWTKVFLRGNTQIGQRVGDYNGWDQAKASPMQFNLYRGRRVSTGKAYAGPASKRRNVKLLTKAFVTKITFEGDKAVGVDFTHDGRKHIAKVRKEVLLAAGPLSSPKILMLSGIGPSGHLKSLGIKIVKDLPVGKGLQDHPAFYGLNFNTNYTEPSKTVREHLEEYLRGEGSFTIPGNWQGTSYFETDSNGGWKGPQVENTMNTVYSAGAMAQTSSSSLVPTHPDLQLIITPPRSPFLANPGSFLKFFTNETNLGIRKNVDGARAFNIVVVHLRPKSSGSVKLASKDPFAYPLVDSAFLTEPDDLDAMYRFIKLALRLVESPAFKMLNATLAKMELPACKATKYLSEEYWKCVIPQVTLSVYHPVGGCGMSLDPERGVVDPSLKVHGLEGLRVVDVSVLPKQGTGEPATVGVMIGEKISDEIKREYL